MRFRGILAILLAAFWCHVYARQIPTVPEIDQAPGSKDNESNLTVGYGISFSSGYGVASAWYPNGTFANIAKIEGGPEYKKFMREIDTMGRGSCPDDEDTCPLPGVLCRFWPKPTPNLSPLYPMISALKASTEMMSEEPLDVVRVSFDRIPNKIQGRWGIMCEVDAALAQASLKTYRAHLHSGTYAARRYDGQCDDPFDRLVGHNDAGKPILTVENTRASLTATLWIEECGQYFNVRQNASHELGQDTLDKCRTSPYSTSCDSGLTEAFEQVLNVTGNPVEVVVVYGEAGHDREMNRVLKEVLSKKFSSEHAEGLFGAPHDIDPTFAASVEAARLDWCVKDLSTCHNGTFSWSHM